MENLTTQAAITARSHVIDAYHQYMIAWDCVNSPHFNVKGKDYIHLCLLEAARSLRNAIEADPVNSHCSDWRSMIRSLRTLSENL